MTTLPTTHVLALALLLTCAAGAQTPAARAAQTNAQTAQRRGEQSRAKVNIASPQIEEKAAPDRSGVLVDQVIGIVNDDLILESDVDEERRFAAFQPFNNPSGSFSRDQAIERLVDRDLILQQAKMQPDNRVTEAEATAQLDQLRKDIPACRQAHCETDSGWQKFVAAQGFTVPELTQRWQQRMEILKFVEQRFRAGIRITPEEIKTYYDQTLLPAYAQKQVKAPALDTISDRVQEVLLQQRVSALLSDWLQQLKAQGSVRMMRPGEVAP